MSEMIERVAAAMVEVDGDYTVMEHHRRRARAAIEAMREPTDEMQEAIAAVPHGDLDQAAGGVELWRTAIDAALQT